MKNNFETLRYDKIRKTNIVLIILGLLVPAIELLTKDSLSDVEWGFIIIPPVVAVLLVLFLVFSKRILIGILMAVDVDYNTVNMLMKRKENKRNYIHNRSWDALACYYYGDFSGLFYCATEIEKSEDIKTIFLVRNTQIKALFIMGEYEKVTELVELQKQLIPKLPRKIVDNSTVYYDFYLSCISKDFEKGIAILEKLLTDKVIMNQNHSKLTIFYFLKMAYKELGNEEQVEKCTQEIFKCDPRRLTFFTR